jgi:3-hydroxybutyryl-CoA dehydrogenase
MGLGIAEAVAVAELPVVVREIRPEQLRAARSKVAASLERAVAGGKLTTDRRDHALDRLRITDDLAAISDAELVIEAVPEDKRTKLEAIQRIDSTVRDDTIIASNTSSIPIAELAAAVENPARVVGLHFFAPVPVMRLVEVVRALETSEETISVVCAFAARLGKRAILTKDRSGFIVNMLLVPYLMAGVRMYEEGFASREDIDEGMRLGCGHPMGPLTLADFIGLDVMYAICTSLYEEFKRPEYAPPPLLKRMLASGRLGKKSGRGFYEYADEGAPREATKEPVGKA